MATKAKNPKAANGAKKADKKEKVAPDIKAGAREKKKAPQNTVNGQEDNPRLSFFKNDLDKTPSLHTAFEKIYKDKKGDWTAIHKSLQRNKNFTAPVINNLFFTHELANWTGDNKTLITHFQNNKETNSMRDIALTINKKELKKRSIGKAIPEGEIKADYVDKLYNSLYVKEPTAIITNMIKDPKVPILNDAIGAKVASILEKQPDFNIKTTSIYEVLKKKDTFKDIPAESHEAVKTQLKTLQRIAAVSPVPDAVPVLYKAKLYTGFQISEIPSTQFMAMMKDKGLDNAILIQIHSNAQQARSRNEHALMALREVRKGTGIAMIDKSLSIGDEVNTEGGLLKTDNKSYSPEADTQEAIDKHNLSWDLLFGDADFCECGECNSVYSATSYFVELLQYLRNNNLDPNATGSLSIKTTDPKDITGIPLEKLFGRRPDLGCLELTCKNTNMFLPYVDLVNEVMENYVAYKHLKPFNVADETSSELLAEPQHTEYKAYCILKNAVYPFTLPYHQPIDAARVYLKHLDTSRHKLIDKFRKNNASVDADLTCLKDEALDRAADAEFLGLTKEEYVILTKECFESKALMDKLKNKIHTDAEYQQMIGVKPVCKYFGYEDNATMRGDAGLTLIKKEFLRRTGIDYFNLVDLLKTRYINPCMPKGKSKTIMESLHFSYRFLQNYAKEHGIDKMAEYLVNAEKQIDLIPKELSCPNSSQEQPEITDKDILHWVKCNFAKVGKMIVIESGRGCVNGKIQVTVQTSSSVAQPRIMSVVENCKIFSIEPRKEVGRINKYTGKVTFITLQTGSNPAGYNKLSFIGDRGEKGFFWPIGDEVYLTFLEQKDSCDLDTALLQHLDGTRLTVEEYDRIHRFIRLWRKWGWTIDEIDKAIAGLSVAKMQDDELENLIDDSVCDDCAEDDCDNVNGDSDECEDEEKVHHHFDINTILIHQFVPVKRLLDKTGIELIKLLSFWTTISTAGEKSLYQRLFLTHNLLGVDKVFKADTNGNYLSGNAKISEHIPVLMAALNLSADDIEAIMNNKPLEDKLTIDNISILYRYRLLSKALGLRIPAFITILPLFGDVFKDAHTTFKFIKRWTKMEDAGFTHQQLNYIIRGEDDERKPFSPSQKAILQLTKLLYDGLNTIDNAHQDLKVDTDLQIQEQATSELVRAKASLLFDTSIVEQIIGLLEGTNVFTTSAPNISNFTIADEKTLKKKLKYSKTTDSPPICSIQITGVLTDEEKDDYNAIYNGSGWTAALTRIEKQQNKLFKELLSGVFESEKTISNADKAELEKIIKEGDINIPLSEIPAGQADTNTAPKKRAAFLEIFLPYLRQELTHRYIVNTLSGFVGLESKITDLLVSEVLKKDDKPIYRIFEKIKESSKPTDSNWGGYLIPAADSGYTFIVKNSDTAPSVSIDDDALNFTRQEEPDNEWWSEPKPLKAGKLYKLATASVELENICWKTPASAITSIPSSALIPDFASEQCKQALIALKKAALLITTFDLSADEIKFLDSHKANFDNLDFNAVTLKHWLRLEAYVRLRNSLPQAKLNMLDFWNWVYDAASDATKLSEKITELTTWKKERIDKLISTDHFNINKLEDYYNEINLLKLQKALTVADKIGVNIDLIFEWAIPTSKFKTCREIANSIKNAIRAKYNQTDWEQVVKPLHDQLRNNQKEALIAYLLQQDELIDWGVTDADGLFEYFLIDVQMDSCMETSRIKQALSSVQLFIQRCFLGLEEKCSDIAPNVLDRGRWDWMQRYRVWEANRKVFLYPENWIEGNLRDDKSPFFKELESELLQKDINKQNVTDALKTFLYKVDEVANMEVVGLYIEGEKADDFIWKKGSKLHVFSRTRNAPYFFYYRYLELFEMNWYPWEKMQVDIPSYDVEDAEGQLTGNGCYLTPVVWNGRLLIFFPQFIKKTKANESIAGKSMTDIANDSPNSSKPTEYWEIKMAWSEYRNGKWTQKQLSKDAIYSPETTPATSGASFSSVTTAVREAKDAAKDADDVANSAETTAGTASSTAQNCKDNADTTSESVIAALVAADVSAVPLVAPTIAAVALIKDLQGKTETVKTDVDKAKTDAENTKKATGTSFDKTDAAVTAANNFEKAYSASPPKPIDSISLFKFVPVPSDDGSLLAIKVFYDYDYRNPTDAIGVFEFNGNNLQMPITTYKDSNIVKVDNFHYVGVSIGSLQTTGSQGYIFNRKSGVVYFNNIKFYHSFSHDLIGKINLAQLEELFKYSNIVSDKADAFGAFDDDKNPNTTDIYNELKCPYSLYNWELFFHTPIMIADALSKAQQFEEAMKWFHYVFNPIADGSDDKRFWQFAPFKAINSKRILDSIFSNLKPNTADGKINEWRNKPFMPHVVARSRPVAYMKWVVMKYIDNLLAWGDYLFRQDTIETINQATQLYVLAGHILGPKPMMIPKRGKIKPQTYLGLLDKWDVFGNAMVELELAAPFSNQTMLPVGAVNGEIAFANIFGLASSLYFCIPNNPKLMGYWDTITDRLYKIRHCQNIEGIFRKLPLFEPPIDPALLVKAAAQGLSIASVLNDLNTPMPNYRFYYLLQKALELCNELKSLGGAMLSAIEKKDNEALSLIRTRHEGTMTNLMMEIKKLQLEESQKSLESLQQNRKAPEARMKYYLQLIGEDVNKMPSTDSEFTELVNSIEKPVDESGLRLSKFEKEDVDKANLSALLQLSAGIPEVLAGILYAIPMLAGDVKPFGVGAGTSFGGTNLGQLTQTVSKGLQIAASHLSHQSSSAAKKGGFQRSLQDRISQANAAGYELKQIDKQITAQQIRIQITNQEITNQQKQIDNTNEVEEFLKNKYTNEELYVWMRGSLKTLYHQVYNLACDLAKKAEKTYCFERGISNANFIQSGYFDASREGLLAGEQLYVGLKQLETAYQEKRGYDYEITKHISLRQIDPLSLLQLKAASSCEFDLPEVLFDMDFPGHFKRRIKSVSVSMPCIAGPYTGVNATLRLLNNEFRNSSIANPYPKKTDGQDDRFVSYNIPITAIATSSAQNDGGMFELNFKDERYLPFEGAGVISRWRIELPTIKQFDYNTISDLVLHVKYIASEGGEQLKNSATEAVNKFVKAATEFSRHEGLFALIDLKHDMPNEWNLLVKNGITNISIDKNRLPYMVQAIGTPTVSVIFISKKQILRLRSDIEPNSDINFYQTPGIDLFKSDEINISIGSGFKLYGYKNGTTPPEVVTNDDVDNTELKLLSGLVMVVKYIL